jgi:spermidine/putrescine transport system permease protein
VGSGRSAWLGLPAIGFYITVFIGPLLLLVVFSVAKQGAQFGQIVYALDLGQYRAALDHLYLDIFARTLEMALLGTAGVIAVGYPVAYWLARVVRRYRGLVLLLLVVPFLTSFLIRTYSWYVILDPQSWFARTFGLGDWLFSWKAIGVGLVYNYLPLFVLPVYATLERMDWSLVDAARDLGGTPLRAFLLITIPLTLPGLIAGTLLVFIPMCGEYVIPNLLGGGTHPFMGSVIGDQFLSAQNYPFGAALAVALIAVLTVLVVIYASLTFRGERFGG